MTRNMLLAVASAAAVAAIAAAAAITSGRAFADDITIDDTPFFGARTRAEVQAELTRSGSNEWTMQFNELRLNAGSITRGQARAEYLAVRDEVKALDGEDSGSAYLAARPLGVNPRAIMGAPAR